MNVGTTRLAVIAAAVAAGALAAAGAVYEAHATKADGTRVELQFDKDYKLVATNADNGPGPKTG